VRAFVFSGFQVFRSSGFFLSGFQVFRLSGFSMCVVCCFGFGGSGGRWLRRRIFWQGGRYRVAAFFMEAARGCARRGAL